MPVIRLWFIQGEYVLRMASKNFLACCALCQTEAAKISTSQNILALKILSMRTHTNKVKIDWWCFALYQ